MYKASITQCSECRYMTCHFTGQPSKPFCLHCHNMSMELEDLMGKFSKKTDLNDILGGLGLGGLGEDPGWGELGDQDE